MNPADDALKDAIYAVDPPTTDGLSAAYAAQEDYAKTTNPIRWGLWVLLGLLLLNITLWFSYTSTFSVWGSGSESAVQPDLATEKVGTPTPYIAKTPALIMSPLLVATTQNPVPLPEKTACMIWSFNNNTDVKRADNRLAEQAWSGFITELADEASRYLVFVGPFSTRAQVEAMLKKVMALKIEDYNLLPNNSISLGLFSTREAGQQLQQLLLSRGLKNVQLLEQPGKIKRSRYRFEQMSRSSLQALQQLVDGVGTLTECGKP